MTTGTTRGQKASRTFWAWLQTKYSPEEIEGITADPDRYFQFYLNNIYGTQWDVTYEPPFEADPAKYGLAPIDWQSLTSIQYDEAALKSRLEQMVSGGRIDKAQAADIWDDLQTQGIQDVRSRRGAQLREQFMIFATGQHISPEDRETTEDRIVRQQKEEVEALRRTGRRGITGIPEWQLKQWEQRVEKGEITEEQVTAYIERRFESQARAATRQKKAFAWQVSPPRPEFEVAFGEVGLGGALPYQDWFKSQFPSIVSKFKLTIPKLEQQYWTGMKPSEVEEEIETKTWPEYLRKRQPELRGEYATRYPFGQYGRSGAFAPRIQTVGF